jgi:periplasmic protein TonB
MFENLIISTYTEKTHTRWAVVVSTIVQCLILAILILIPLIYTDALPKTMLTTWIAAPPPPPPPPPPAAAVQRIVKPMIKLIHNGQMMAPTVIPKKVEIIHESDMAPDVGGVVGGVPGGVPGGSAGGVLGGIIGGVVGGALPPPPRAPTPARIRVGGNVQQAMLVRQVLPIYPPIAKTAHISGSVVLHAIIGKDGTVEHLEVVSGPPLLVRSAMDAVQQWRYRPTMLNSEPVEVDTTITVVFTLGG